jgi:hypothetical protein
MVVLWEGTMKEHTALHMVEIQYLKGKLAFEDTLDHFVEFQHKKYQMIIQMKKKELTIFSSLMGLRLVVDNFPGQMVYQRTSLE